MASAAVSRILRAWPLAACLFASACAVDDVTRAGAPDAPLLSTLSGAADSLGAGASALGINDAGTVVGAAPAADSGSVAFSWSAGGGPRPLAGLDSTAAAPADTAHAINATGQIAGSSVDAGGVRRAVLWADSLAQPEALGELQAGGWSAAYDVNAAGTVAGAAQAAEGVRPFVWTRGGGMTAIGTGTGAALAVGTGGHVVGWTGTPRRAFVWTAGGGMQLLPGLTDGGSATATDVNAAGVIVGHATNASGEARAVIWIPPFGPVDLGTLGGDHSAALAISDRGMVVGTSTTASGETHAFAWFVRSLMRDLGTLGGNASAARAINRTSVVAGQASDAGGVSHATRWTVTEHNSPPVAALAHPDTLYAVEAQALRVESASTDPEGDPLAYLWSFGDGRTSAVFFSRGSGAVTKRYADNGTYALHLMAVDPSGARDTAAATVVVANAAPSATLATTPVRPVEGTTYRLSATRLVDGPADLAAGLEAAFDCGDGAWTAWSRTLWYACPGWPDDATVQMRMRVRDKDGGEAQLTRSIAVTNAAPVVSVTAPEGATAAVGAPVQLRVAFTDPGASDGPWTYRIAWADRRADSGTVSEQAPILRSHVYNAPGTYAAVAYVTDRQGRQGRATITITVTP